MTTYVKAIISATVEFYIYMKVIRNKFIPFKGYKAVNLFGVVFQRSDTKDLTKVELNHEAIHTAQGKELLWIFFYIIYLLEWVIRLFQYKFDTKLAYRAISFEVEAYANQNKPTYLSKRKRYAQWRKQ